MANILVVDDELGIRDLLSEILNDEGHSVDLAENATQARSARAGNSYDLVLLDIWMPDTDGVSLLKEWATAGVLTMPVIMMSGHATIDTAVEAELDPRCPWIAGDAQQLRQVVHNLLQNAQDSTEQARAGVLEPVPPVRISTRWSESSRRVRLTVSDSGGGFPSHILQRAFEPYFTTKPRGTGLGLAVVKKIADEHGARIELSNRTENDVVRGAQVSLSFAPEPAVAS